MSPKEFLNQPFELNKEIERKKRKAADYREMMVVAKSPGFEEHNNSNPSTESSALRYLNKAMELEDEVVEDYKELEKVKREVDEAIEQVEDFKLQKVLRCRYVCLMSIRQMSDYLGYSPRWTKRLNNQAVEDFEKSHPQATPKPLPVPLSRV